MASLRQTRFAFANRHDARHAEARRAVFFTECHRRGRATATSAAWPGLIPAENRIGCFLTYLQRIITMTATQTVHCGVQQRARPGKA